jgi:hypothetical protein
MPRHERTLSGPEALAYFASNALDAQIDADP